MALALPPDRPGESGALCVPVACVEYRKSVSLIRGFVERERTSIDHQLGPFRSFVCSRIVCCWMAGIRRLCELWSGTSDTEDNIILHLPQLMIRALQYTVNVSIQHIIIILYCSIIYYILQFLTVVILHGQPTLDVIDSLCVCVCVRLFGKKIIKK